MAAHSPSEVGEAAHIDINGTSVPGLRVRELDAVGVLAPGQTLLAGGMTQFRDQRTKDNRGKTINEVETLILTTVEQRGSAPTERTAIGDTQEAHLHGPASKR
ncbi:MAG TPA: hypothetical protein VGX76_14625 [Pirellulales bacterium]|nr:hypothetical protein [Pirellulales bacterium]